MNRARSAVTPVTGATAEMSGELPHGRLNLQLLASLLGLMFLAGPALSAIGSGLSDAASAVATLFALPVVLSRFRENKWIVLWVSLLVTTYVLSSIFSAQFQEQGVRNTLAALTGATALMVFIAYGREMVAYRAWRWLAAIVVSAGAVAILFSGLPKNITGGTFLYLIAAFVAILMVGKPARASVLVFGFFLVTAMTALLFDFRSLIGYTAVLVVGYVGARVLPKKLFWLGGAAVAAGVIGMTTWYFLNVATNEFAVRFTEYVSDTSGRRATSGRDWLWPNIIATVNARDPWFGLGAGALPRDIMPTNLSSHSYYVQLYLQLGWVGLVILVLLLLAIWNRLAFSRTAIGSFGAAVFLMYVSHNSTEVLMFQNGLIAGIPAWCTIGLCIAASGDAGGARSDRSILATPRRV